MIRVFADTSGLISLKDSSDTHHGEALGYLTAALAEGGVRLVLTNFILAEVHAYFSRTPKVALEYLDRLLSDPLFQVLRASPKDEEAALGILRHAGDKTYSMTDAISFAVMDRLGIDSALAFDKHFRQHGRYRILP